MDCDAQLFGCRGEDDGTLYLSTVGYRTICANCPRGWADFLLQCRIRRSRYLDFRIGASGSVPSAASPTSIMGVGRDQHNAFGNQLCFSIFAGPEPAAESCKCAGACCFRADVVRSQRPWGYRTGVRHIDQAHARDFHLGIIGAPRLERRHRIFSCVGGYWVAWRCPYAICLSARISGND